MYPAPATNCFMPQGGYAPGFAGPAYMPSGYAPTLGSYGYGPSYAGRTPGQGLANMLYQRDSAQLLYRQAVQSGNHVRAHHLNDDVVSLNKKIANLETKTGQSGAEFPSLSGRGYNGARYAAYPNSASYAYPNTAPYGGGLTSMLGPFLGRSVP